MKSKFIVDPSMLNFDDPIADINAIRESNPQRHEMEQLTSILHEDVEGRRCAALKVVTQDEFWVRGHMPNMPLMPGVIMLEAAAQLCSCFAMRHDLASGVIGFGGVDSCRFRGIVKPGDNLVLMVHLVKVRPGRMIVADFQGVVDENIVVEGTLRGINIPADAITS